MSIELVYCVRDENGNKTTQKETTGKALPSHIADKYTRAVLRGSKGKTRRQKAEKIFSNATDEG